MLGAHRAEGGQAGNGVLLVVDEGHDVGGAALASQCVVAHNLCDAAPAKCTRDCQKHWPCHLSEAKEMHPYTPQLMLR